MNIEITANLINSIGLFFDIIGAWFVAIEVFRFKGKTHTDPIIYANGEFEQDETQAYKKDKTIKHKKIVFGLVLLILGFVLQIISNHIPPTIYIDTKKTETILPKQTNQKQQVESNQLHRQKLQIEEKWKGQTEE